MSHVVFHKQVCKLVDMIWWWDHHAVRLEALSTFLQDPCSTPKRCHEVETLRRSNSCPSIDLKELMKFSHWRKWDPQWILWLETFPQLKMAFLAQKPSMFVSFSDSCSDLFTIELILSYIGGWRMPFVEWFLASQNSRGSPALRADLWATNWG